MHQYLKSPAVKYHLFMTTKEVYCTILMDYRLQITKCLSDCVEGWLLLKEATVLNENISAEIDCRYQDVLTPYHRLAYLLDHRQFLRKKREDGAQEETEVESSTTKSSHPRPQMSNEEEDITLQLTVYL